MLRNSQFLFVQLHASLNGPTTALTHSTYTSSKTTYILCHLVHRTVPWTHWIDNQVEQICIVEGHVHALVHSPSTNNLDDLHYNTRPLEPDVPII